MVFSWALKPYKVYLYLSQKVSFLRCFDGQFITANFLFLFLILVPWSSLISSITFPFPWPLSSIISTRPIAFSSFWFSSLFCPYFTRIHKLGRERSQPWWQELHKTTDPMFSFTTMDKMLDPDWYTGFKTHSFYY